MVRKRREEKKISRYFSCSRAKITDLNSRSHTGNEDIKYWLTSTVPSVGDITAAPCLLTAGVFRVLTPVWNPSSVEHIWLAGDNDSSESF